MSVNYVESDDFKIDGILDEAMWRQVVLTADFTEYFPTDSKSAEYQTEMRVLYKI